MSNDQRRASRREAELRFVASLLLMPSAAPKVQGVVRAEDFTDRRLAQAYERLCRFAAEAADPDAQLEHQAIFPPGEQALGLECYQSVTSGAHYGFYARQVALWSFIDRTEEDAKALASSMGGSFVGAGDAVLDFVREHVAKIHTAATRVSREGAARTFADELEELIRSLDQRVDGVSLGIADIDRCLAPIQGGNMLVVASRAGVGKTTFALNSALHAARQDRSVLFLSLEMSVQEMLARFASRMSGVNGSLIRRSTLNPAERAAVEESVEELRRLPLAVREVRSPTSAAIAVEAASVRPALIVVDYLQLVTHPGAESRAAEVAAVSGALKQIARDTGAVVLAVSQLSRQAAEGRPALRDLRWAGEIEQDADAVVLLWREQNADALSYDIAKHRHGSTRDGKLYFDPATYKIGSIEARPV